MSVTEQYSSSPTLRRLCPPVIRVSGVKKSYLSEDLFTDGKRQIQRSRDVIFHDPGHTLVEK